MSIRDRLTPARVELVAIAAFVLVIVWPFVQRDRLVISLDGLIYSGPHLQLSLDAFEHGRLPLWNREIFGGVSHAGNPQTGFWYPLLLLGLPFSVTRALNVLSLVHLLLFAGGMVALCRWRLRLRPPAAFVGTAVALGGGAMASKTIQFEQLMVVAWLPVLLALLHWLVTADRPWRPAAWTALATGAWLCAGHPQTHYLLAPLLVVWTVALAIDCRAARRIAPAAGAALTGALIALPHLLLALRATRSAALSEGRTLDQIRSLGWLDGRSIVPKLLGDPTATNHAVRLQDFESTTYVGAAAAVLAVAGLVTGIGLRARRATTIGLGLVAVVGFVLAAGPVTPVFRIAFDLVPGFDLGRVASRWVLPAALSLAVLAAWGADAARDAAPPVRIAILAALGGLAFVAIIVSLAYRDAVPAARVVAVWIVVGAVTAAASTVRWRSGRIALAALVVPAVLVGSELGLSARHSFARGVLSSSAPETASGPALDALRERPEGRTLALTFDEFADAGYLTQGLRPNVNATFGIASIDGYDGGVQVTERWAAVFGALIPGFDAELTLRAQIVEPFDPVVWARLGVRHVLADVRGAGNALLSTWPSVLVAEPFVLYENPAWVGEAVASFAAVPVASPAEAGQTLAAADPIAVAVESPAAALICTAPDCAPVGLPVERRSPGHVRVRTDLAAPAVVSIDEQFDDGWHVRVDGRSAEPIAVDGMRVGVLVPEGAHDVRFTYRPAGLTATIVVSVVAMLTAAVVATGTPDLVRRRLRPG